MPASGYNPLAMTSLILASQSLQRASLLKSVTSSFKVIPADIDELSINHPEHDVRVVAVAQAKIDKVRLKEPEAVIISADTFVVLDGKRLEKPDSVDEAREMLTSLSGKMADIYTGWAYNDPEHEINVNHGASIQITFRELLASEIENYVTKYPVTKWAGGFSLINIEGIAMIAHINGSLTGVLGLPIEEIVPLLKKSGLL